MRQKIFDKIGLFVSVVLIASAIGYLALQKTTNDIPYEEEKNQYPISNLSDNLVSISMSSSKYRVADGIVSVYVFNNLEVPIFIMNTCGGIPYIFLQRMIDSEWKSYAPFPTMDCGSVPPFTEFKASRDIPYGHLRYELDLRKIYGRSVVIAPGTYRLEMNYTTNQDPTLLGVDPLFVQIFSDKFYVSN